MTAVVLVLAGFLLLGFDAADFSITGLSLLAAFLIGLGLWLGGAFRRSTWIADDETSARLSAIDVDLNSRRGTSTPFDSAFPSAEPPAGLSSETDR